MRGAVSVALAYNQVNMMMLCFVGLIRGSP